MIRTFSQIMLCLSVLFDVNQMGSEELLCLTDSQADGSHVKFAKGKRKAQHLGCHKPCKKLTG